MSVKVDKLRIHDLGYFFNRRIKLIPCQRLRSIDLHNEGISYRKIALIMGGVNHRTIMFIVNPQSLIDNVKKRTKRTHYTKEEVKLKKREERKYKRELVEKFNIKY